MSSKWETSDTDEDIVWSNVKALESKWKRLIRNINDFYCPYMPISMTDLVTLEDFATRRGWATQYGKAMIQPKYYLTGRITR